MTPRPPCTATSWRTWRLNARGGFSFWSAWALGGAALASNLATYAALMETPFFGNDRPTIMGLLTLDLVLLVLLGTLVVRRLWAFRQTARHHPAGSRLHRRVVGVFVWLAAAPSLMVVTFAAIIFSVGVETWFSDRVQTALNESQTVAEAYLKEHQQVLRADVLAMASDLNRQADLLARDPVRFAQIVSAQSYLRSLTEVLVFDGTGKIMARTGLTFALAFEPITDTMREGARHGDVVLWISDKKDRVRAFMQLDGFADTYLLVGRPVEPRVLEHMKATQDAVTEYRDLKRHRVGLRNTLVLIFGAVAALVLLTAVWFGLNFASRLVRPIGDLMNATDRVRQGDLTARVPEKSPDHAGDELDRLGAAFNRMTEQLHTQRADLVDANRQIDERRRFIETVLSGVSAGVLGMDSARRIHVMNPSAAAFFNVDPLEATSPLDLETLAPAMAAWLATVPPGTRFQEGEIEIPRTGQASRRLLVRLDADTQGDAPRGYVLTFDDISDLVAAQRKAAWADVARRLAHEIKNPLTPIQLSAERLQRKYGPEVQTDPEVFQTCIATIVRHVEDIGRMVDEFSSFARMPRPVIRVCDVRDVCRQTLFLHATGRSDIAYTSTWPEGPCRVACDARQISQALTNLLKNAAEAIEARPPRAEGESPWPPGQIHVTLGVHGDDVSLTVEDNGKGLPVQGRERLTEPYMTTRAKGTGLGLAIVRKIMEDHHGTLTLTDRPGGGARIGLIWPRTVEGTDGASAALPREHI